MQWLELGKEAELAAGLQGGQALEEQAPEQPREHTHRQQEAGAARHPAFAIERQPTAGHDTVQMGMMGHGRAPGMQHGGHAQACTQTLGIGPNRQQRLGGALEQQVVYAGFVVIGDIANEGRHGEHDMKVLNRQ